MSGDIYGHTWWNWSKYTVSPAAGTIGDVMQVISQELPGIGYSNVQRTADVHGTKGNFVLAVVYLHISGPTYWQVVACGGHDTVAKAQSEVNEVTKMISNLTFL
jgi:hypothetical protein